MQALWSLHHLSAESVTSSPAHLVSLCPCSQKHSDICQPYNSWLEQSHYIAARYLWSSSLHNIISSSDLSTLCSVLPQEANIYHSRVANSKVIIPDRQLKGNNQPTNTSVSFCLPPGYWSRAVVLITWILCHCGLHWEQWTILFCHKLSGSPLALQAVTSKSRDGWGRALRLHLMWNLKELP